MQVPAWKKTLFFWNIWIWLRSFCRSSDGISLWSLFKRACTEATSLRLSESSRIERKVKPAFDRSLISRVLSFTRSSTLILSAKTSELRIYLRVCPLKVKANSYLSKPFLFFCLPRRSCAKPGLTSQIEKIFFFPLDISGNCDKVTAYLQWCCVQHNLGGSVWWVHTSISTVFQLIKE